MDKSYLSDVLAFAPKDQYERNQQAGTSSSFGCFGRGDPFGNPINTVCQGVDVARCVVTLVPSSRCCRRRCRRLSLLFRRSNQFKMLLLSSVDFTLILHYYFTTYNTTSVHHQVVIHCANSHFY